MGKRAGGQPGQRLVERDVELSQIKNVIRSATAGVGRSALIIGPAGIGKTALLDVARDQAESAGCLTAVARGGELEAAFPYCVVRQLFETTVRSASPARRERLLGGTAAPAALAVLDPVPASSDPGGPASSVVRGLHRLVANIAAERPLAVLIDDVHWADTPSLRFVAQLVQRRHDMPVALVATVRTGDGPAAPGPLASVENAPNVFRIAPAALSESGVASLLFDTFGTAPDEEFTRACVLLTGGNPFFVSELAGALRADRIEPTRAASAPLAAAAPQAIARATLTRLGRLSEHSVRLARSVAVLGSDCTLARAAAVAELTAAEARDAVDTLVAADVLAVGNELRFRHPIVRSAIYRELAPGARSIAHRAAATELAAHGASLDAVAGHLLRASPAGSRATIVQLREAADHALAIGAPESAVAYLDRALEEAPDRALRAELLLDLARAEQVAGLPSAGARFEEVQRLASDPVIRATAMIERARIDIYTSDAGPALTLLDLAIEELAGADEALRLRAEAVRAVLTAHDPRLVSSFVERLPIMRELAVSGQPGTRPLALLLAAWDADRDQPPGPVLDLIDRGWADGQYLDEGDSFELLPQTLEVLVGFEQFDRAAGVFQRIDSAARLNGSTMLQLTAVGHRALIEARRGDLAAAETELRAAVERALELELRPLAVSFLWYCSDVLVERPDAADVSDVLETTPPEPISGLHAGALLLEARARARFSRGARDEAIGDLRRAGAIYMALGVTGGRAATWRSALALMLGPAEREEALALSSAELERARRAGNLRRIGIALRALGTLEQSQSRLEEAVRVLARSPAQLEHARALVELGGARRRQGERAAGAAALRAGLELATRCGAVRLGERAELELAATGSRSRRDVATGYDELTPSELRVARLAADGRTSREIAEELFVTVRTVNTHLNHAYRKLGINSRKQLADTLASRA